MISRRMALIGAAASALVASTAQQANAQGAKLVLIHGRSQEGRKQEEIKKEWLDALKIGAESNNVDLPPDLQIELPFYGDLLEEFTKKSNIPVSSKIKTRGGPAVDEYLQFQAEVADEIRKEKGITDQQVNAEYGNNTKERGPLNWEWVQAIVSAIDKHGGGLSGKVLEQVTRDVFLYTNYPVVRDAIDQIVQKSVDTSPTVMVAHSLGSVVAYSILHRDTRPLNVHLITVGSPLAIRAIRRRFTPISFPPHVGSWKNAFDKRDIVALYPLDKNNFDIDPAIENYADIKNKTDNRHGISGYLDSKIVANWVHSRL